MDSILLDTNSSYAVEQVFTPSTNATLNFVPRMELENRLTDALRTPGRQIVLYGHSGSGKSSLLNKKLNELYAGHIVTRCHESMSFESLVLDAFDQLGNYYISQTEASKSTEFNSNLEVSYLEIRAAIGSTTQQHQQLTLLRVTPPQLTPQRLAQFLGAKNLCWVLEDFHKILPEHKRLVSQILKVFVDESSPYPSVRIVALGAVGTAREVVAYDSEMKTRVSEIHVPLMSNEELGKVLNNGQKLLNVEFPSSASDEIVRCSAGLGSICHQLALNMCRSAGVERTCLHLEQIPIADLEKSIERYVADCADSLKSVFDNALRRKRVRKYHNVELILKTLAAAGDDGLTMNAIWTAICKIESAYPQGNLIQYLTTLTSAEHRILRFDANSGRYAFLDPFLHAYAKAMYRNPVSATADVSKISLQELMMSLASLLKPADNAG